MSAISDQCSMRERVERLESIIEQAPQVDCPVRHHFAPGVYMREMTIPAGVALTGAVHKTEHANIVLRGHIVATTDDGTRELRGGDIFVSKAGTKRAGVTLEETVWITVHATTTTNLDALVEELSESTAAELLGGSQNKQLAVNRAQELENKQ